MLLLGSHFTEFCDPLLNKIMIVLKQLPYKSVFCTSKVYVLPLTRLCDYQYFERVPCYFFQYFKDKYLKHIILLFFFSDYSIFGKIFQLVFSGQRSYLMENNIQISCLIPSSIPLCVSLSFYLDQFQETFKQMVPFINKI